jgi:HK97 family phage major capsid protein
MKIKMVKDSGEYRKDTVIDCDELTAKEFLDAKTAEVYTEVEVIKEKEAVEEAIALEVKKLKEVKKMTQEVKDNAVEVKGTTLEVVKQAPGSEWKSMGEFLKAVKIAEETHRVDPRLEVKASAGLGEDSNAVGGYLVQHPLWNQEIFSAYMRESVIAPKCRQFVVEDYANGLKFKQIDETARSVTSQWGGVRFYNVDEGVDITDSKPAFTQLDVPIKQMGALYYITQQLVDDCPNISTHVAGKVGQAFGWMTDNEILNGTLSIMTPVVGHNGTKTVTVAGTYPTAAEWTTMYNAMSPGYRGNSEWYMGTMQYAALMNLSTPILATGGLSGIPLFTKGYEGAPHGLLFGRKINVIEQATSTKPGQIIFGCFDNYALLTKGTLMPHVAMSLHVKFLSNQQTFRFISRLGGAPLIPSKITLPDTSVVASFVTPA